LPNSQKAILKAIQEISVQKAIADLLEEGVDEHFFKPMLEIFQNGIMANANVNDLIDELQQYTMGDDEVLGALERYTKQVNSDTLSVYTANYTQAVNQSLDLEFYIYLGNHMPKTRCFCDARYGHYFHKYEIESWGNGDTGNAVSEDCGYPWKGMIQGTNSSTIYLFRGGWNCQHQLVPTMVTRVPKDVVERAINMGYYKPTDKVKKFFGIE